jgi:hypothetical protein
MYNQYVAYEDESFRATLYETEDNVVQLHAEVFKPITKSVYRTMLREFDEGVSRLAKIGVPCLYTACHDDPKDIAFLERLGFEYVSTVYDDDMPELLIYELDLTYGS